MGLFAHTVDRKNMRRLILPLALGMVLTVIPTMASASTGVAFVDPADGRWYLPDGSGSLTSFAFGAAGDTPISGDWNCDGTRTPAMYRPTSPEM